MARKLKIDGHEVEVDENLTLLQACEEAGVEIPHFCYHERLSIAGNCRMCLVEVVGAPKLVASCSQQVKDLRPNKDGSPSEILTTSDKVKHSREGVMEFLLVNHPLDCPICDQGGECDLQDQAFHYGHADFDRFHEEKRTVVDKNMGPLIATHMTRCIQCTRCVRFATEIAGVPELGATGRGGSMEITTYLEKAFSSELSGNVIDLCPVGALTSKPYAYTARPWELKHTDSVDVMDAQGCNIRVDTRGNKVMRIQPRVNEDVNAQWLGDKSRFVADGLMSCRIDKPYVRENGKLVAASWEKAISVVAEKMQATPPEQMAAIVGDTAAAEDIKALKDLMVGAGVKNLDCRADGAKLGGLRPSYLFNTTISGVDKADAVLFIGANPRLQAPVLNARMRQTWLANGLKVGNLGEPFANTYPMEELGTDVETLVQLAGGDHPFAKVLRAAHNPMLILGPGAINRTDGAMIIRLAAQLALATGMIRADWNGFNVLHNAASRVAAMDLGFLPGEGGRDARAIIEGAQTGEITFLYALGEDSLPYEKMGRTFIVYQGSHGDKGAENADVVLPGATYCEKDGLYINFEGRVQDATRAIFPPGVAKDDWEIPAMIADRLDRAFPYKEREGLRAALTRDSFFFLSVGNLPPVPDPDPGIWQKVGSEGTLDIQTPLKTVVKDYYLTNPIARASRTLRVCSGLFVSGTAQEAAE